MRGAPTILHLDMDAFYASAEQASKPSLRGKPVIVGGLGPRGVVSTASYEARVFGVHSAMAMAQARRLCPNAAYLTPRFSLYRRVSDQVMGLLRTLSPLVEPLSLDEAFVDLEAGGTEARAEAARAVGERLRADIRAVTGLTGSVGLAGSKMLAKIASEQAKPDGMAVIPPGTERELLDPMPVRTLPGVGPATAEALRRAGIHTVAETREAGEAELVRLLGRAHGTSLYLMASGRDERPVVAERDAKSVSVEDTFDVDLTDRTRVQLEVARLADRCVRRLREAGRSGRTVVIKVRRYDFSTLTRSETLRGPTDDPGVVKEAAARLIDGVDTTAGVRLLGVGVTGLADYTQEDLFAQAAQAAQAAHEALEGPGRAPGSEAPEPESQGLSGAAEDAGRPRVWLPGTDVRHTEYGAGWVQGSGVGRVTIRFEEPWSRPGRVRTFAVDDPALEPGEPLPLVRPPENGEAETEQPDTGQVAASPPNSTDAGQGGADAGKDRGARAGQGGGAGPETGAGPGRGGVGWETAAGRNRGGEDEDRGAKHGASSGTGGGARRESSAGRGSGGEGEDRGAGQGASVGPESGDASKDRGAGWDVSVGPVSGVAGRETGAGRNRDGEGKGPDAGQGASAERGSGGERKGRGAGQGASAGLGSGGEGERCGAGQGTSAGTGGGAVRESSAGRDRGDEGERRGAGQDASAGADSGDAAQAPGRGAGHRGGAGRRDGWGQPVTSRP
ncbi:DNA polymerase IV [Streptomyces sp. NPDC005962]|uniref:DNA polymerase IV n=1 Tax=Streptomyces sp. NPDC005962 TaxID=3154466 RepID=UPI0033F6EA4C